jgi:hypothetical protein
MMRRQEDTVVLESSSNTSLPHSHISFICPGLCFTVTNRLSSLWLKILKINRGLSYMTQLCSECPRWLTSTNVTKDGHQFKGMGCSLEKPLDTKGAG